MRRTIAKTLALVLACGLVACGADDADDASDADRASDTDRAVEADRAKSKAAAAEDTGDGVTPPGGGKKVLNHFGRPPTTAERAAIVAAVDRYHAAVAADDAARICAEISRAGRRVMTQDVGDGRPRTCVDRVDIVYSGYSDAIRDVLEDARIHELRVKGKHAIAIAIIPGPRTLTLPMERERGTWRYGTFGKWTPTF